MTIDEIIGFVSALDGVLSLRPGPGDGSPEISWGDTFFYYSPDGVVPKATQPFATIVTKNYPGDESSGLDRPEAFRVNIAAGKEAFTQWTAQSTHHDPSATDTLIPHPVYASAGWLAVINPGPRTSTPTRQLLESAYKRARARYERHATRA
ncbi:DUF6194 family protein [Nocardia araoensis]|uniref:DUF6194 family protein n=1 Tax=Nocardia araoensis TaxID=228600 RepID=UPI0002F0E079|nr:DUF6194 family protein [Nocardia araoensis]